MRRTPTTLLLLGDLVCEQGDAQRVDGVVIEPFAAIIEPFAAIIDGDADLLPMLGNHDYRFGEQ
ncbi:MAG: hypothetical protein ACR2JK_18710 [Geodermatophilaceae bacterium]